MLLVRGIGRQSGNRDLVSYILLYFNDDSFWVRYSDACPSRIFLNRRSRLSLHIWLTGSHPSSRNSGRVLAWKGASRIMRAHHFWTLKIASNSPALQLLQTDTQYSRIGLIIALNRIIWYLTGKNYLMRARTATHLKIFLLRLATWGDQERKGSISRPKRVSSWVNLLQLPTFQPQRQCTFFTAGQLLLSTNNHVFCLFQVSYHTMIFSPCRHIREILLKLYLNISQSCGKDNTLVKKVLGAISEISNFPWVSNTWVWL